MRALKLLQSLGLLLAFGISGSVVAEPRVVVSLAPLHSLVSALMQGVTEPVLLFERDVDADSKLDPFQKGRMITADMLVWVGPGLETPLAQMLEQSPMLRNKLITLSNYLPLLRHAGYAGLGTSRQSAHDMTFWSDPRLAIMAVRMITPRLVRLDPDHQEIYLDNEIALIKQLQDLEQEISDLLAPYGAGSALQIAGVDQYFRHRYLASAAFETDNGGSLRKVSTSIAATCTHTNDNAATLTPGSDYYFAAMRQTAQAVAGCMQRLEAAKTVSNQNGPVRKEF